jgi:cysteine-rich repeat protein
VKRLALLLLLGGCNSLLGIDDLHLSDAGADDDVAPDAPVAPPDTVVGTSNVRYIALDGATTQAPEDLSGWTVQAYIPDDTQTSGYRIVDGEGLADGTFSIADVPEDATYMLRLLAPELPGRPAPVPRFFVTDEHVLDLGYNVVGRADAVLATQPSPFSLSITNMQPWVAGDQIVVDSFNSGSESYPMFWASLTNPPAVGATALSSMGFDWVESLTYQPFGGLPALVDASKGDDLFITHTHVETIRPAGTSWEYVLERAVDVVRKDDVMQALGDQTAVSGAFAPITLDRPQAVFIFVQQYTSSYPGGRALNKTAYVSRLTNAGVAYGQPIGAGLYTVSANVDATSPMVLDFAAFMYGDPFPAEWADVIVDNYTYSTRAFAQGATTGVFLNAFIEATRPAADDFDAVPLVRPPTAIMVDGADGAAGGRLAFDGGPVTLSWTQVSAAQVYEVEVARIYREGTASRRAVVARLWTAATSIDLPGDLLADGTQYAFAVNATRGITGYATGALRRTTMPRGGGKVYTGAFRASSHCGNGTTEADEECDPGATETASCDIDCTMPRCRDATLNVATGETCDHGGDSMACDSDCSVAMCGDGYENRQFEQCDDGNTTEDPNGCSATCERIGFCGDAILQSYFEACDDGDGGTCADDCSG